MTSRIAVLTVALLTTGFTPSVWAQEKPTITFNGFFDGYYSYNFNNPKPGVGLDAATVSGAVIPTANNKYRYYDTYHDQLTVSLAELSVKVAWKQVSLLTDLDFGPFADLNASASSTAGTVIDESSKNIGQAVLSYRAENSNFSFDAGKMYSHLGVETVKSKDNFNYSRSILFSYAIPFWHTGVRLGYDVIPETLQTSFYIYNGWNTQYEVNRSKTLGFQVKYRPNTNTTIVYNFLGGPERSNSEADKRIVHELNWSQNFSPSFALIGDLVHASEENALTGPPSVRATWYGGLLGAKYLLGETSYLSPRFEIYRDSDGFNLGGLPQTIQSFTITYSRMIEPGFETRIEARTDQSNIESFVTSSGASKSQSTVLLAALFSF